MATHMVGLVVTLPQELQAAGYDTGRAMLDHEICAVQQERRAVQQTYRELRQEKKGVEQERKDLRDMTKNLIGQVVDANGKSLSFI